MKDSFIGKVFNSTFVLALTLTCVGVGTSACHRSDAHKETPNKPADKDSTSDKFGGSKASQTESTGKASDASVPTTNSQAGQYGSTANAHDPNSSPNSPTHVDK